MPLGGTPRAGSPPGPAFAVGYGLLAGGLGVAAVATLATRGKDAPPAPLTKEQQVAAAREELRLAQLELESARAQVAGAKKPQRAPPPPRARPQRAPPPAPPPPPPSPPKVPAPAAPALPSISLPQIPDIKLPTAPGGIALPEISNLKLPAIDLSKASVQAPDPTNLTWSNPYAGLAVGAAVGAVPAFGLVALRSWLVSGRNRAR